MTANETLQPPKGWNGNNLVATYVSDNPCNSSKFAHPFDRCLYRGLVLTDFELVGVKTPASDHYGILATFVTSKVASGENYIVSVDADILKDLKGGWIIGIDNEWLSAAIPL